MNYKDLITKYYHSISSRDINKIKEILDDTSPIAQMIFNQTKQLLELYKLKTEVLYIEKIGETPELIVIQEKTKTIRVEGNQYKNNVSTNIHVLRKINYELKIFSTTNFSVDWI